MTPELEWLEELLQQVEMMIDSFDRGKVEDRIRERIEQLTNEEEQ